uniref:MHD domain-containing protein n=1 Tax=Zea mays TaxID=4577 RepID=A0A804UAC2_MAIZE
MPTSVRNQLQRPAECPPAPRKPVWAPPLPSTPANKRSRPSPPSSAAPARWAFFPVARPHHRVPRPTAQEADPRGVTLARRTGRRGSGESVSTDDLLPALSTTPAPIALLRGGCFFAQYPFSSSASFSSSLGAHGHGDQQCARRRHRGRLIISKEIDMLRNKVWFSICRSVPATKLMLSNFRHRRATKGKAIDLDDIKFHQLSTQVKPLIWVEAQIEKHSRSRIELMVKARSQFKERSTATNVEIEVHVPSDATNPNIRTSMGSAAYAPERDAMVWKIKSFPGGKEYMCRAEFSLPSITAEEGAPEKKAPIQVKFEIPYFTVSGIQVVYILGQVRAMDNEMLLRIKQYGLDMMPKILILSVMANMDNVECPVTRLVGTPRWKFFISKIMKSICDLDKTLDLAVSNNFAAEEAGNAAMVAEKKVVVAV